MSARPSIWGYRCTRTRLSDALRPDLLRHAGFASCINPPREGCVDNRRDVAGDDADLRFVAGRCLFHTPWATLLADYNVFRGRLWILVLAATIAAPPLVYAPGRSPGAPWKFPHRCWTTRSGRPYMRPRNTNVILGVSLLAGLSFDQYFAGVTIDQWVVQEVRASNAALYGRPYSTDDILRGGGFFHLPSAARTWRDAVGNYFREMS